MRSPHPSKLGKLGLELGATVMDPSLWPKVMAQICEQFGATGAALLQSDVRTPDIPRTDTVEGLFENYFRYDWHKKDFRQRGVPLLLAGRPVFTDQDVSTPEQMERHPFYQEAILPFGFKWFAGVGFWAGENLWCLAIQRTPREGPFEADELSRLAQLSTQLTQVATLSNEVGRVALASAVNALDSVCQPAVAIDRFGTVVNVNAMAETAFDDHIYIKNRKLHVSDEQARNALERLADQLRAETEAAVLRCDPIVVRRENKSPVVVRVLPVHVATRTPFFGARALLTLTSPDRASALDTGQLMSMFALTPAEAKLAVLAAQGKSPEQIAEGFGIAVVTARNQLKSVFSKTGTHRQAELVALLSRL